MDCTNCGAPLPAKSRICTFCNTLNDTNLRGVRTTARHDAGSRGNCPRCEEPLTVTAIAQEPPIDIDRCNRCHGIFFDPGELEDMLERSGSGKIRWVDRDRLRAIIAEETPTCDFKQVTYLPCPDCGERMNRRNFGIKTGVVTDQCREHGIWLDGGELHRLMKWRAAGGQIQDAKAKAERELAEARMERRKAKIEAAAARPEHRLSGYRDRDSDFGMLGGLDDGEDLFQAIFRIGRLLLDR